MVLWRKRSRRPKENWQGYDMWRATSKPSYGKRMSCLYNSYSYKDRGKKTSLTSWENNNNRRRPQQPKIPQKNSRERKELKLKLRH